MQAHLPSQARPAVDETNPLSPRSSLWLAVPAGRARQLAGQGGTGREFGTRWCEARPGFLGPATAGLREDDLFLLLDAMNPVHSLPSPL